MNDPEDTRNLNSVSWLELIDKIVLEHNLN